MLILSFCFSGESVKNDKQLPRLIGIQPRPGTLRLIRKDGGEAATTRTAAADPNDLGGSRSSSSSNSDHKNSLKSTLKGEEELRSKYYEYWENQKVGKRRKGKPLKK